VKSANHALAARKRFVICSLYWISIGEGGEGVFWDLGFAKKMWDFSKKSY